jgi:hypothetical protein
LVYWHFALHSSRWRRNKKFESDRPGETKTPAITEKNYFQFETGFLKEWKKSEDYSLLHPETVIKYGLSKRLELRMEITAATEKLYSKYDFRYGLKPLEFGVKARYPKKKVFFLLLHSSVSWVFQRWLQKITGQNI